MKKTIVIGIGGAGCNVINYLSQDEKMNILDFLAIGAEKEYLDSLSIDHKLFIGEDEVHADGVEKDQDAGKKGVEKNKDYIYRVVSDHQLAVIIFGGGGGIGASGGEALSYMMKDLDIQCVMIGLKPFRFEANIRNSRSEQCFDKLRKENISLIVFENDTLLKRVDRNTTLKDSLDVINKDIENAIEQLSEESANSAEIVKKYAI